MSTYLLAYIVSEFTYVNMTEAMSTNQNVLVRSWARLALPGLALPEGSSCLPQPLSLLGQLWGVP